MGHGNTSCDPHLHQSHQAANAPLAHAKRLPQGGYVLTTKPDKWLPVPKFPASRQSGTTLLFLFGVQREHVLFRASAKQTQDRTLRRRSTFFVFHCMGVQPVAAESSLARAH